MIRKYRGQLLKKQSIFDFHISYQQVGVIINSQGGLDTRWGIIILIIYTSIIDEHIKALMLLLNRLRQIFNASRVPDI